MCLLSSIRNDYIREISSGVKGRGTPPPAPRQPNPHGAARGITPARRLHHTAWGKIMSPVLQEIFVVELRQLYGTESEQTSLLPQLAESAADPELQRALEKHLETTKQQIGRLDRIFQLMGEEAEADVPEAVRGLITDIEDRTALDADDEVIDLAIIAGARKMEVLEAASYESLRAMAEALELKEVARLLDETIREEAQSERNFQKIERPILKRAAEAEDDVEIEDETEEESGDDAA
jgi:ferritin-like metal-binding protein YciE